MEAYVNKIAVVTGSSSGIGAGISKELAKRGCIVIGLARRMEKLQLLSEEIRNMSKKSTGVFHPMQCDITVEQQLYDTFAKIVSDHGIPSILVNNAGLLIGQSFKDLDGETFDAIVSTNAKGLLLATKEIVKLMTENSLEGHVLNINSTAGHYLPSGENYFVYCGSKHMTRVFVEGIRKMIVKNKWNIKISNISPGLVRTPMVENDPNFISELPKMLSVDDVVKACITVLDTPPNVLISELIIGPIHGPI